MIGDALVGAGARGTFATHDPHDGSWLADVPVGGPADVDAAVRAARAAFPAWAALGPEGRRPHLHAVADLIDRDAEELALLETRDSGKPIRQSRADIARSARNLRFFADWAAHADGEAWVDDRRHTYVRYEPAGVAACISPWNFPLMQATWKVAPALAFGCTAVLKPAEQTPLTATRLGSSPWRPAWSRACSTSCTGSGPTAPARR